MDAANRNPDMATSLASSVIAVSDILTLSVAEISERMKRSSEKNSSERHIFEIAEEGARLTAAQQDVVDSKLREATALFKTGTSSQPVSADALSSRLGNVVIDEDGFARLSEDRSGQRGRHDKIISSSRCSISNMDDDEDRSQRSNATTVGTTTPSEEEAICRVEVKVEAKYNELRKMNGRPVCSLEAWHKWISDPHSKAPGSADIAAWLSQPVEALSAGNDRATVMESLDVYSQQARHWWGFLRYQASHRGLPSNETEHTADAMFNPFADFVAVKTSSYGRTTTNVHASHKAQKIRELKHAWNQLPDPQTVRLPKPSGTSNKKAIKAPTTAVGSNTPDAQISSFGNYCQDIKNRLAPYHFRHSPALHIDPRQQTQLATWLEYLCFELAYLEPFSKTHAEFAPQYHRAWAVLKKAAVEPSATNPELKSFAAASLTQQNAMVPPTNPGQEAIRDFLKQTALYRHLDVVIQRHQARIQWIVSEARAMEAEAEATGESNISGTVGRNIDHMTSEGYVVLSKPPKDKAAMDKSPGTDPANDGGSIFSFIRHACTCLVKKIRS